MDSVLAQRKLPLTEYLLNLMRPVSQGALSFSALRRPALPPTPARSALGTRGQDGSPLGGGAEQVTAAAAESPSARLAMALPSEALSVRTPECVAREDRPADIAQPLTTLAAHVSVDPALSPARTERMPPPTQALSAAVVAVAAAGGGGGAAPAQLELDAAALRSAPADREECAMEEDPAPERRLDWTSVPPLVAELLSKEQSYGPPAPAAESAPAAAPPGSPSLGVSLTATLGASAPHETEAMDVVMDERAPEVSGPAVASAMPDVDMLVRAVEETGACGVAPGAELMELEVPTHARAAELATPAAVVVPALPTVPESIAVVAETPPAVNRGKEPADEPPPGAVGPAPIPLPPPRPLPARAPVAREQPAPVTIDEPCDADWDEPAGEDAGEDAASEGEAAAAAARARGRVVDCMDPSFIAGFYASSRLHFIGRWKEHWVAFLRGLDLAKALPLHGQVLPESSPYQPRTSRVIVHIDMDCFFGNAQSRSGTSSVAWLLSLCVLCAAAISIRDRPELAGAAPAALRAAPHACSRAERPVAVAHSASGGNSEVSSCNYPARKFGVRAGMWMARARELCPDLVVVPYEFEKYLGASRRAQPRAHVRHRAEAANSVYGVLLRYTHMVGRWPTMDRAPNRLCRCRRSAATRHISSCRPPCWRCLAACWAW